jgi:5-methylcytosine-specific restriction enzyme A
VAQTIRQTLADTQEDETIVDLEGDDIEEAEEGRLISAMHRRYERDPAIIRAKKRCSSVLGRLACEACGFDFEAHYGERGAGFIECHHTQPVHTLKLGEKTRIEDLRLLCSNCHRMVHAKRRWLTNG